MTNAETRRLQAELGLTPTEFRVAALIAEGKGARQVAVELNRGYSTVRGHLKNIFAKTNTHRQSALAILVVRHTT